MSYAAARMSLIAAIFFLNPNAFLYVLVIFYIFKQKFSMIAFIYACILTLRLRYKVEEHSGEILAF